MILANTPVAAEPNVEASEPLPALIARSPRLVSLDALRGFDMIWIIGGDAVIQQAAKLVRAAAPTHPFVNKWIFPWVDAIANQFEHVDWEGFHAYDLIFPMFVFLAGVSIVFSLSKQLAAGGRRAAVKRVIIRSLWLYVLGLLIYGGLSKTYHDVRLMGVLQRIAICYLFAGLLFCYLRKWALGLVIVGILVGYWALLAFAPVPGVGHASFVEGSNWPNYIDSHFLPGRKWDGDHDPEGLLSNLPAIAGCLMGVFAGLLLKASRPGPSGKVGILLFAGLACGALGYAWGHQFPQAPRLYFPIVKKLWTSSFVLVTAGYASVLLAMFYLVIDILRVQRWATPFVWVGANAITLYLAWNFFKFPTFAQRFIGGQFKEQMLRGSGDLMIAILSLVLVLLLGRLLYRRQIFLRV